MTALNYHFSGVAGAGMNPLARLMRARGHRVQGSDRALDQGLMLETAALLRGEGIALVPQDGAAIGAGLDRFVYSTAVEAARTAAEAGAKRLALTHLSPRHHDTPGLLLKEAAAIFPASLLPADLDELEIPLPP